MDPFTIYRLSLIRQQEILDWAKHTPEKARFVEISPLDRLMTLARNIKQMILTRAVNRQHQALHKPAVSEADDLWRRKQRLSQPSDAQPLC